MNFHSSNERSNAPQQELELIVFTESGYRKGLTQKEYVLED